MADEPNQPAAVMEPEVLSSAVKSEGAEAAPVSTPPTVPDWHKAIADVPDEELEKHPKLASVLERRSQARSDQVLHRDRERIGREERQRVALQEAERQRQQYLSTLDDTAFGRLVRQDQRYQQEFGKTIGSWWAEQSHGLKEKIPEFAGKPIEEWQALIERYPQSFGDLVAAAVNEAVEARFGKELPKRVREGVEAALKEQVQKSIASGGAPDLRTASTPGDDQSFLHEHAMGTNQDHARAREMLARLK